MNAEDENMALLVIGKRQKKHCGAQTRTGQPCKMRALANGRCKFHGGFSTGPKTETGRAAIAKAQKQRWRRWRSEHKSRK